MKKILAVVVFVGMIGILSIGVTGCDKPKTTAKTTDAKTDAKTTDAKTTDAKTTDAKTPDKTK